MAAGADPTSTAPSARDHLMLSRARAYTRLQLACTPADRASIEQAIAELDARLAALARSDPSSSGSAV